jgi:PEGA domain
MKIRAQRYNLLFVLGLILTLGLSTTFAAGDKNDKKKNSKEKDMATLTVKTSPASMPVKVDGEYIGMSGVGTGAEFYITPGTHTVEVSSPDGKTRSAPVTINIDKGRKVCVCLKLVEETRSKPCPYSFHLEGPGRVMEGEQVVFTAIADENSPVPVRFTWSVSPDSIHVISGGDGPSITLDSTGMGGKTINAVLDVNDSVYDGRCRQTITVPTDVDKKPSEILPIGCDEWETKNVDQDKARLDTCVIQVQNTPDAQLYVVIYPGTDKASTTRNTYERLYKRTLDYLVNARHIDPSRLRIVEGTPRARTSFKIWIVPPGATPPVAQ